MCTCRRRYDSQVNYIFYEASWSNTILKGIISLLVKLISLYGNLFQILFYACFLFLELEAALLSIRVYKVRVFVPNNLL